MRRFGLIGFPLSHSFSQKYFTEKFKKEGIIDATYDNFPIPSIADLKKILEDHPDLVGINVTIPYKRQVLSFLDNKESLPILACNCIKISNGKLSGYNTDIIGFHKALLPRLRPIHSKALVLGTGGASDAVCWVLAKLGISVQVVSRRGREVSFLGYEELNEEIMKENLLIINCTPLGMNPHVNECPQIPYQFIGPSHYLFDLIYNPAKTIFLQKGESNGASIENGADMLVYQAEESWKIWNNQ
ncbi:MAG: shikimate dehydrogenase family protein [Chitinophagales bacterium]